MPPVTAGAGGHVRRAWASRWGVAGALGTDDVDVVDLSRASALLRFEAARDGLRLAGTPETHERFVLDAVRFWCDAGPVIRRAQDDVLAGLDR